MNFALVMVKPDGTSKEFPFTKDHVLIGRDEESRLRIPLGSVSRRHCMIAVEDDELTASDLGSANGSYVNGERLKKDEHRELSPGDLLTIGGVVFVVRIDGYPAKIDARDCYAAGMVSSDGDDDDLLIPKQKPTPGGKPLSPQGGKKADDGFADLLKDLEEEDE